MWLNKLQIALIEKDTEKIDALLNSMPQFEKLGDIEQAFYLLKNVSTLLHELRDQTSLSMKQLKKHMDFMNSTQSPNKSKLDIKL